MMRTLERNKRKLYFANYEGKTEITDDSGNLTGEYALTYSAPQVLMANVSVPTGAISAERFGLNVDYDTVITLDTLPDGMNEASVFWIGNGDPISDSTLEHNYRVACIALSINSVKVSVKRVDVNG